jgi:hypothetical protein
MLAVRTKNVIFLSYFFCGKKPCAVPAASVILIEDARARLRPVGVNNRHRRCPMMLQRAASFARLEKGVKEVGNRKYPKFFY